MGTGNRLGGRRVKTARRQTFAPVGWVRLVITAVSVAREEVIADRHTFLIIGERPGAPLLATNFCGQEEKESHGPGSGKSGTRRAIDRVSQVG